MDILEDVEQSFETYDIPLNVNRRTTDQHHSDPLLPKPTLIDPPQAAHSSAPSLENNKNCGNIPKNGDGGTSRSSPHNKTPGIPNKDHGIYMNTTFKAEEKLQSIKSPGYIIKRGALPKPPPTGSLPTPKKNSEIKNLSMGLYLSPPSRNERDPIPTDSGTTFYDALDTLEGSNDSGDNDVECLYEGIDDVDEDLGSQALYEGLKHSGEELDEDFYEGVEDEDGDDDCSELIYEGIPDVIPGVVSQEGEESEREGEDIKQLIDSIRRPDRPYQPPKPPPVPFRRKGEPLPAVPSQALDALLSPRLSPNLLKANGKTVFLPIENDTGRDDNEDDDGFYDGIDLEEDEAFKFKRNRSQSLVKVKESMRRTANTFEKIRFAVTETLREQNSIWRTSKTRTGLKTAIKGTRVKAVELLSGTEIMMRTGSEAVKRRSNRWNSKKKRHLFVDPNMESGSRSTNIELEDSGNFISIQPETINLTVETKDVERKTREEIGGRSGVNPNGMQGYTIMGASMETYSGDMNSEQSQSFDGRNSGQTERQQALQHILDHEYRYIIALKDIMKVYAAPLQQITTPKVLLEPDKVHEIFHRIPEITVHHEFFYEQLRRRSMTWSPSSQLIGDVLIQLFHKPALSNAYASYINNFHHALDIIRESRSSRPSFARFLEKLKSRSNQLSLEDLIFFPLDHVPSYLELLKQLISCTPPEHPDYSYLYMAKDEVEKLIEKLEERRVEAEKAFSVKQLERKISGLPCSLIVPQRYVIGQEKIKELDIVTEASGDRCLILLTDLILCLKPLSRTSTAMITPNSSSYEFQYLWDCQVTDLLLANMEKDEDDSDEEEPESEEFDAQQVLKDDLEILEKIDVLRKQLSSSYSELRLDKISDIKERLKKKIAERQFNEECKRGRILDVIRPLSYPCTTTQFHRFLFSTAVKRATWVECFQDRQNKIHRTKDLDWCQVGDNEVLSRDRLSTLLPSIKHMTPIGLTTPSEISVECGSAVGDFRCPVTLDLLAKITSKDATYPDASEIELRAPAPAPAVDTPVYESELSPKRERKPPPPLTPVYSKNIKPSEVIIPPIPGNHPLKGQHKVILNPSNRAVHDDDAAQSVPQPHTMPDSLELPKEFEVADPTDVYLTPDEISLMRAQKRQKERRLSMDDKIMFGSNQDLSIKPVQDKPGNSLSSEEATPGSGNEMTPRPGGDLILQNPSTDVDDRNREGTVIGNGVHDSVSEETCSSSRAVVTEDGTPDEPDVEDGVDPSKIIPNAGFYHPELGFLPDESFNLELTESNDAFSALQKDLTSSTITSTKQSLLVDKYGQVYTDNIASLISAPSQSITAEGKDSMRGFSSLNDLTDKTGGSESTVVWADEMDNKGSPDRLVSLLELESDDEDDTPKYAPANLSNGDSGGSSPVAQLTTPKDPLPQIEVPITVDDVEEIRPPVATYENVTSTKPLKTRIIRRESSKRSEGDQLNRVSSPASNGSSAASDEWLPHEPYENINEEDNGPYTVRPSDVFLCGHNKDGNGEVVVLRLAEPTPHVVLNIALERSQVLCSYIIPDTSQTLWLGTQDSRFIVYNLEDMTKILDIQLPGGSVACIAHVRDTVFVGTSDGYIHLLSKQAIECGTECEPLSKKLGNHSICTMLPIGECMWISCGCQIFVLSHLNATVEHLFSTHNNTSAQVYKMVSCGSGVWLAIRNSPVLRLFHAKTGEHLQDYDISSHVHHIFTGSQNSNHRRKSENVRITALLVSTSTAALWIGTSAGVILVVPIAPPPIVPKVAGPPFLSYMGHYSGVRFLIQAHSRVKKLISTTQNEDVYEETTSEVVISGGKGMEDYRDFFGSSRDRDGLDRRTYMPDVADKSYLIIWHYPNVQGGEPTLR